MSRDVDQSKRPSESMRADLDPAPRDRCAPAVERERTAGPGLTALLGVVAGVALSAACGGPRSEHPSPGGEVGETMVPPAPAVADSEGLEAPEDILFTASHVNFAWGFQANGCAIQRDGTVVAWTPDHPAADTLAEAGGAERRLGSVSSDSVVAMAARLPEAEAGPVERRDGGMRDFGSIAYVGRYSHPSGAWRQVTLLEAGDWVAVNQSAAAGAVVRWMSRVLDPYGCPDPTTLTERANSADERTALQPGRPSQLEVYAI